MFDATPQSAGAALACKWTAILAQVLLVQGVTSIQEFACDSQDCIRETRRSEEPRLGRLDESKVLRRASKGHAWDCKKGYQTLRVTKARPSLNLKTT